MRGNDLGRRARGFAVGMAGAAAVLGLAAGCSPPPAARGAADPGGSGPAGGAQLTRSYADSIQEWHDRRVERLRAPMGWLSVAGLWWLEPGENRFGSDSTNAIVLPPGLPGRAGAFFLERVNGIEIVRLVPAPQAGVEAGGEPARTMVLATDVDGDPTPVTVGRVQLTAIRRGGALAIRMRDPESPRRARFAGIHRFRTDERWRVEAKFVPFQPPAQLAVPNIKDYADTMTVPGELRFQLGGVPCRLYPVLESPDAEELFIIFSDETTGRDTYGGGRFLYAPLPRAGRVVLDFNRAYNPPCAFTPFTTCPLPPRGNALPVGVLAGEMAYRHDPADRFGLSREPE